MGNKQGERKGLAEQKILLSHYSALAASANVSSTNPKAQRQIHKSTDATPVTKSISNTQFHLKRSAPAATTKVGSNIIPFNNRVTRWLEAWLRSK